MRRVSKEKSATPTITEIRRFSLLFVGQSGDDLLGGGGGLLIYLFRLQASQRMSYHYRLEPGAAMKINRLAPLYLMT